MSTGWLIYMLSGKSSGTIVSPLELLVVTGWTAGECQRLIEDNAEIIEALQERRPVERMGDKKDAFLLGR